MRAIYTTLLCGLALARGSARADLLSISFQQSVETGAPGSMVLFSGALTNLTSSTIYLNLDSLNLAGFDPTNLDDSPFFANTPTGFLGPNASTGLIGLFNVTIPNPFPSGSYNGTFQILGGGTFSDLTVLDVPGGFTVQVQGSTGPPSSVPEPSSVILILTVVILMAGRLRVARGCQRFLARPPG
jgi:hypothetical protein